VQEAEVDSGQRPGTTSGGQKRIAELEREVRELRRANEILKAVSAYFARELRPETSTLVGFIVSSSIETMSGLLITQRSPRLPPASAVDGPRLVEVPRRSVG
jgi:hypothetical protein